MSRKAESAVTGVASGATNSASVGQYASHWKQVWQEHECRVRLPGDGQTVRLPYRITWDVTLDQRAEHL